MPIEKSEAYNALVKSRKACRLCQDLKNPSDCDGGIFDSDHIGPWSIWEGNLDTQLMIIGQDWGGTQDYQKYKGRDPDHNSSNKTILHLLYSIGIEIPPPSMSNSTQSIVFLTNAILCLKKGKLGAPVKREWFENCGPHYLKPLIEIVKPKVVVSLGRYAYQSLCTLYGLPKMRFRDVVDQKDAFLLSDKMLYFAMYHCSPRVLLTHRKFEQQKADWQRVKKALEL